MQAHVVIRAAVIGGAAVAICSAAECLFIDRFDRVKTPDTTVLRFEEALKTAASAASPFTVVAFQDSATPLRSRGVSEIELCADAACISRRAQQLSCTQVIGGSIQTVKQNVRVWAVLVDATTGKSLREIELEFPGSLPSTAAAEVAAALFTVGTALSPSREIIHDKRKERRNLFVGALVGTVAAGVAVALVIQIATSEPEQETVDVAVEW